MTGHLLAGLSNRLLADAVILLHAAYLVFLVVGGFIAWRRPRVLWPHLAAVAWALGIVSVGYACPLTGLERHLRGTPGGDGFIDQYVEGVVYPEGHTTTARVVVAVLVAVSYAGILRRRRRAVAGRRDGRYRTRGQDDQPEAPRSGTNVTGSSRCGTGSPAAPAGRTTRTRS